MSEVRPWVGSTITIGKFKTVKNLVLIDCNFTYTGPRTFFSEPDSSIRKETVWFDIGEAFSIPITNSDNQAEYTPTQVIAELFKVNGFDGIKYRSTLGEGENIALFDIQNADLIDRFLSEARKITYKFSRVQYVR